MVTARDIASETLVNMGRLAQTYSTLEEMFAGVARQADVSESMVRKMYYGSRGNPSVNILDRVTSSVNVLLERR